MTIQRILVGVDGSVGSRRAVAFAADRAADLGAEVIVVMVMDPSREFVRDLPPTGLTNWRQDVRRKLKTEWVEPLRQAGVSLSIEVLEGLPAETLIKKADDLAVDLIVIGTHGHGGIADRLTGSVSYTLTHRARRPVIVVPPDDAEASADAKMESDEAADAREQVVG
jgi:universal stress protein A